MKKEEQVISEVIVDDRYDVTILAVGGYGGDEGFFHGREELFVCVCVLDAEVIGEAFFLDDVQASRRFAYVDGIL